MKFVFFFIFVLGSFACGKDPGASSAERDPFQLINHSDWREVPASEDPFADEGIAPNCNPGGALVEGEVFELNTDICPYGTFKQGIKQELKAGDELRFSFWHLALVSSDPAEAHVVLDLGGERLIEERLEIPGQAHVYPVTWTAPSDFAKDTAIYFHLHNHGYNSYRLSMITVEPQ